MLAEGAKQARLLERLHSCSTSGVCWSTESDDLDCNLVNWCGGESVAEHVNSDVDVFFFILSGSGRLSVNNEWVELSTGFAILVEKNVSRSIVAGDEGLAYLSIHKRRRRLMPGAAESRFAGQQSLKEMVSE